VFLTIDFWYLSVHKLGNERKDRRTCQEHYASGQSRLEYTHKNSTGIFGDVIAFACFHNTERVLSAIAKFFLDLLGKGRPDGVEWEGGG